MSASTAAHAAYAAAETIARWSAWTESVAGAWAAAASPDALRQWVEGLGPVAPLVFLLMEAAQVVFSPLPGGLLPPVGALAFGPWAALLLSLAGCAAGAAAVFALARRFGQALAERLLSPKTLERYAGVLSARGGFWLFVIIALPMLPGDAICTVAGLSSISFRRFLAVSTLARVPSTAASVFLASELPSAPAFVTPVVLLVIAAAFGIGLLNRGRVETWLLGAAGGRHEQPASATRPLPFQQ